MIERTILDGPRMRFLILAAALAFTASPALGQFRLERQLPGGVRTRKESAPFHGAQIRYHYYVTTRTDMSAAKVVRLANQRCDQENLIAQLKGDVDAMRVPLYDLVSNFAYMVIAALAWNLKSWFSLMMHRKADRRRYVAMEFRTFIREMILLPCQVIRRARRTTLRIIGWQPSVDRLFSVWGAIERTGFGSTSGLPTRGASTYG